MKDAFVDRLRNVYDDNAELMSWCDGSYEGQEIKVSLYGMHRDLLLAADLIEELNAILRKAKYMRQRQKQYFKDKTKENLIASKQAEAAFDRALAGEDK